MQAQHRVQRWPDWLLAIGLAALGEVEVWLSGQSGRLPAAVAVVVTCGALVWRRRAPLATALAVSGGLAATSLVAPDIDVLAELVALVAAVYTLGAQATARRAVFSGMAVLAVIWCSVALSPENSWGSFAFTATAVGVPLMAGRALQDRDLAARAIAATERGARSRARCSGPGSGRCRARPHCPGAPRHRGAQRLHHGRSGQRRPPDP